MVLLNEKELLEGVSLLSGVEVSGSGRVVLLGAFDGVHIGHRELISRTCTVANEKNIVSTITTFRSLPAELQGQGLLLTLSERINMCRGLGIADIVVLDFYKLQQMSPLQYLEEVLLKALNVKHIVAGVDHRFGQDRQGDISFLYDWSIAHDISLDVVELVSIDNQKKVSSSIIRQKLLSGEIQEANSLLGYNFFVDGDVLPGWQLGREMRVPTINSQYPKVKVKVPHGVYAGYVNGTYPAAINYGISPTLKEISEPCFESHILSDFEESEISDKVRISLVEYIRPEQKFNSQQELKDQILKDIKQIRTILKIS